MDGGRQLKARKLVGESCVSFRGHKLESKGQRFFWIYLRTIVLLLPAPHPALTIPEGTAPAQYILFRSLEITWRHSDTSRQQLFTTLQNNPYFSILVVSCKIIGFSRQELWKEKYQTFRESLECEKWLLSQGYSDKEIDWNWHFILYSNKDKITEMVDKTVGEHADRQWLEERRSRGELAPIDLLARFDNLCRLDLRHNTSPVENQTRPQLSFPIWKKLGHISNNLTSLTLYNSDHLIAEQVLCQITQIGKLELGGRSLNLVVPSFTSLRHLIVRLDVATMGRKIQKPPSSLEFRAYLERLEIFLDPCSMFLPTSAQDSIPGILLPLAHPFPSLTNLHLDIVNQSSLSNIQTQLTSVVNLLHLNLVLPVTDIPVHLDARLPFFPPTLKCVYVHIRKECRHKETFLHL